MISLEYGVDTVGSFVRLKYFDQTLMWVDQRGCQLDIFDTSRMPEIDITTDYRVKIIGVDVL